MVPKVKNNKQISAGTPTKGARDSIKNRISPFFKKKKLLKTVCIFTHGYFNFLYASD